MHHMVDGGYYDNYGIASALDWLEPVLRAEQEDRTIDRIALVELRSFKTKRPALEKPKRGSVSALIGPLLGLLEIRSSAALERNRIATDRFLSKWSQLTDNATTTEWDGIEIRRFVFETPDGQDLPLSWKLSEAQKKDLETEWSDDQVQSELTNLKNYLAGESGQ